MSLRVQRLGREQHRAFVRERAAEGTTVSFTQCPSWGDVKPGWRAESIGWYEADGTLAGAGLVLYRQVPRLRRYFAYLPEGPVVDWYGRDVRDWLDPMLTYLKREGAFTVKIGPRVALRHWEADTVKQAIADPAVRRLREAPPDHEDERAIALAASLRQAGWQQDAAAGEGFGDFQPRYVFQLPIAGRSTDEVFAGFNQLWRRNVRKAEKAGVTVTTGSISDLPTFHELYRATSEHQNFTPRPLSYFEGMFKAMEAEDADRIRLYLGRHEGETLAADLRVSVGGHVWYSYGGTALHKREVRASNAVQWRMITDAIEAGAHTYDLRGTGDVLSPDDHLFGLIQFKVGTGARAVEYLGEWDFPLNKLLHKAFDMYMNRR